MKSVVPLLSLTISARSTGSGENSPWGSQILVSGSLDTLVWRNKVRVNANYGNGIFLVEEGRQKTSNRVSNSSEYVSRGNIVLNNEISFDGAAGNSGLANTKGNSSHLANLNRFEDNVVSTPKSELRQFLIGSDRLTLDDARNRGQELRSRTVLADKPSAREPTCMTGRWPTTER